MKSILAETLVAALEQWEAMKALLRKILRK